MQLQYAISGCRPTIHDRNEESKKIFQNDVQNYISKTLNGGELGKGINKKEIIISFT